MTKLAWFKADEGDITIFELESLKQITKLIAGIDNASDEFVVHSFKKFGNSIDVSDPNLKENLKNEFINEYGSLDSDIDSVIDDTLKAIDDLPDAFKLTYNAFSTNYQLLTVDGDSFSYEIKEDEDNSTARLEYFEDIQDKYFNGELDFSESHKNQKLLDDIDVIVDYMRGNE